LPFAFFEAEPPAAAVEEEAEDEEGAGPVEMLPIVDGRKD